MQGDESGSGVPAAGGEGAIRGHPGGFFHGLKMLPRGGLYLVRHPSTWPYALLPLAINVVLFAGLLIQGLFRWLPSFAQWLTPGSLPAWVPMAWLFLKLAGFLAWVLAAVVLVGCLAISFTTVGCVIAAPFNDALSDRVEELLRGQRADQPFDLALFLRDLGRTLFQAASKLAIIVGVFVVTLPLLLIPLLGQVAYTAINLLVGTWYLALEYVDLPMGRHRWKLAARRRWCHDRYQSLLGFGSGVYLTTLVPLLGFLVMPCAVAGGTMLWLELSDPRGPEPPRLG